MFKDGHQNSRFFCGLNKKIVHGCMKVLTSHVMIRDFGSEESLRTLEGFLLGTGGRRQREKELIQIENFSFKEII